VSNQPTEATLRKDAPTPRRGVRPSFAFGVIPAAVVATMILLIGIVTAPPRYIARASFVVDWNSLRSVLNDEMADKLRNDCRTAFIAEVTSLPDSEPELSDVLDRAGDFSGSQTDKAAVISRLHKRLRVTLAGQADDGDLFAIEMRDDDSRVARAAADWVLQGTVSKLKAEVKAGSGFAALRSRATPDGAQLEQRPFNHAEAGFGAMSNLGGVLFIDPIKLVKPAQVEERGIGRGWCVLLAAVVAAVVAGGLGLLLRQLILAVTELMATVRIAPRTKRLPAPAPGRIQAPPRPILLRPLPPV
jgi:hypothetical protein